MGYWFLYHDSSKYQFSDWWVMLTWISRRDCKVELVMHFWVHVNGQNSANSFGGLDDIDSSSFTIFNFINSRW